MQSIGFSEALTEATVARVMEQFKKEFPAMVGEWGDEVYRRATELLYRPIYDDGFTNVAALADFAMVEIRLIHRSGTARPTARQADMRRRDAWNALVALEATATKTKGGRP